LCVEETDIFDNHSCLSLKKYLRYFLTVVVLAESRDLYISIKDKYPTAQLMNNSIYISGRCLPRSMLEGVEENKASPAQNSCNVVLTSNSCVCINSI
jgi:hypothetical protein